MVNLVSGKSSDLSGLKSVPKSEEGIVLNRKKGEELIESIKSKGFECYLSSPESLQDKVDKGYEVETLEGKIVWINDAVLCKKSIS